MFELHITPQTEFLEDFKDIAQRLKLKLISHVNYDLEGNELYEETMIAEKCKNLTDLNNKLDLMFRTAKHHNLLRIKVESIINDDFSHVVPYKLGTQYYEVHVDVTGVNATVQNICKLHHCAISKNPDKDTYMLTHRSKDLKEYKSTLSLLLNDLDINNIEYTRVLKEYCFLDDNVKVDDPWLDTYKTRWSRG